MFRKTLFWMHLSTGVLAGLVILMMSATGVALTYERQMLAAEARDAVGPIPESATPLAVEVLLDQLHKSDPAFQPGSVIVSADARQPVVASAGRSGRRYLDPYSGEVLGEVAPRLRAFFNTMTGWHRWFDAEGDNRKAARAVTGASNLLFLFLVLSGLYLWLPPVFNAVAFRVRVFFNPRTTTSKARDYNWHHVFGIWIALPLVVIVATATVFSYGWASDLVYRSFGEEPPTRGRGETPAAAMLAEGIDPLSLDELLQRAAVDKPEWRTLTLNLPDAGAAVVTVRVDEGTGGQPQLRMERDLDRSSGAVVAERPFSAATPGRQARIFIRFLHTGEALGVVGQTVAGIVSLLTLIMVWTGLALSWRRLISPLLRRRLASPPATARSN